MKQVYLKSVAYSEAISAIKAIRQSVFQEEQGVDAALEFDGKDEAAEHLLAYLNSQPVGTARVRYLSAKTAKIERLAVLSPYRGQGIGKKIMEKALEIAAHQEIKEVVIHAQEYVKALYVQLGFEQEGESFQEANIPHVKMKKSLE
ncbi:MAG: GNAT family N-acetyltransferase [Coleofasciculaceae cyanobacterium]